MGHPGIRRYYYLELVTLITAVVSIVARLFLPPLPYSIVGFVLLLVYVTAFILEIIVIASLRTLSQSFKSAFTITFVYIGLYAGGIVLIVLSLFSTARSIATANPFAVAGSMMFLVILCIPMFLAAGVLTVVRQGIIYYAFARVARSHGFTGVDKNIRLSFHLQLWIFPLIALLFYLVLKPTLFELNAITSYSFNQMLHPQTFSLFGALILGFAVAITLHRVFSFRALSKRLGWPMPPSLPISDPTLR